MQHPRPYILIDPDDHVAGYVGITEQDLDKRLTQHISEVSKGKGGEEKQEWLGDILDSGAYPGIVQLPLPFDWELERMPELFDEFGEPLKEEEWEQIERYWIWRFGLEFQLVNRAAGGKGQKGATHSEEVKAKISESMKAYKAQQDH
jgi:hypothetical protein